MTQRIYFMLFLCLFGASVYAVDYGYVMSLETSEEASGFAFNLPPAVYQKVHHADLRDLRVVNAAGDEVPMRLSLLDDEVKQTIVTTTLPVFALNQIRQIPMTTQQVKTSWQGDARQYEVTTSKTMQNYMNKAEAIREDVVLIDASVIQGQKLQALELQWTFASTGNRVFYVQVQGSHNLSIWHTIHNRHKLVELDTGGRVVLENSIPFSSQAYEFYQLRFLDQPSPQVDRVKARLLNQAIKQQRQWQTMAHWTTVDSESDYVIEWDTKGHFPIEGVKLDFDYKNLMADLKLYSKPNVSAPWRQVSTGRAYAVGDMALFNDEMSFRPNNHRYWRLSSRSGISKQWIKGVSLAWRPHQLLFLAQGEGPYALLMGAQTVRNNASTKWYQQLPTAMRSNMFSTAIEPQQITAIYADPLPPKPMEKNSDHYSRYLFWGLLLVVLTVLLLMASRLLKELNNDQSS